MGDLQWFTMENPKQKWMRTGGAPMTSERSRCDFLGHPEPGEVHNVYVSDTVRWAARNTLMVCSLVKMPIQDLGDTLW